MNPLLDLNEKQAQAVQYGEGPLLVLAGPGTGKTHVITHRVAFLIRQKNVPPERILAITFTNKAAQEMRDRVEQLLGATGLQVWIETFHAACTRILRDQAPQEFLNPHFAIFDQELQEEILTECLHELGLDRREHPIWSLRDRISYRKARGESPVEPPEEEDPEKAEVVRRVAQLYEQKLARYDALDFDDLILRTVQLFQEHEAVRQHYHEQIQYLLVDEYQDINQTQYALICLLANPQRNVTVVADPDQAIYSWRGSDIALIERFRQDFHPEEISLEVHYRSTQTILNAARALIARNQTEGPRDLTTANESGTPIYHYRLDDPEEEARTVLRLIQRLIQHRRYAYGDIAVFYRTHRLADTLEELLLRERIPVQRVQPSNTFQRERFRSIVAFLRYFQWRLDLDLLRIVNYPRQRLDTLSLARLRFRARTQGVSLSQLLDDLEALSLGPVTRRRLQHFLEQLQAFLPSGEEDPPVLEIVRRLMALLDAEQEVFPGSPDVRSIRGLRPAADSLFRAIQLGESIHLFSRTELECVLATTILERTLREYLRVMPEVHWLAPDALPETPLPEGTHVLIGTFPPLETDAAVIRLTHEPQQEEEHLVLQDPNLAFVALRLAQRLVHYFEIPRFEGCIVCAFRLMGTHPGQAELLEIAASKLDATGRPIERYHARIRPKTGTPPGWTARETRRLPSIEVVLPEFVQFIEGHLLVGHEIAGLPVQTVERELQRIFDRPFPLEVYDTFEVARRLFPRENCSFEAMAARLGIAQESLEEPLPRLEASQKIFRHVVRREQEQRQLTLLEEMTPWVVLATEEPEAAYVSPAARYCQQHALDREPILTRLDEEQAAKFTQRWQAFQSRWEGIAVQDPIWQQTKSEFLNRVAQFVTHHRQEGLREFVDYQGLLLGSDEIRDPNKVTLMTLHAAKGTEFPVVILIGMEEGSFPLITADESLLREERRLCYVGMTRARERLYLCSVRHRGGRDGPVQRPSRFVREIPRRYLRYWSPEG